MFWNRCKSDTPVTDAVSKKYDVIKENDELKAENADLKKRVENFEKIIADINSKLTEAKPVIDFDVMRVFSIERMANDNKPCTVIGYFINEPVVDEGMAANRDVVHQWYLYCNDQRHAELTEQFLAWKAKK